MRQTFWQISLLLTHDLTLSNLIGMAMRSSLKYLWSSFHEQRSSRLRLLGNTHTESTQSWFQPHFHTNTKITYYPSNPCSSIVVNWFLFFIVNDFEKIALSIKKKIIFYHALTWKGHDVTWKWKKIRLLFIWRASNNFMGKLFLSLNYFLTSECSQCTRSKVSHVQLTPTMLGVVASVWT